MRNQPDYARRVNAAVELVAQEDYEVLHLETLASIRWHTGFAGSLAIVHLSGDGVKLFVDSRYANYVETLDSMKCVLVEFCVIRDGGITGEAVKQVAKKLVAVEPFLAAASYVQLAETSKKIQVVKSHCVTSLRRMKDSVEIQLTKQAISIAEQAFLETISTRFVGESESSLRRMVDAQMLQLGADGSAFDTMVLSGANAAQPHGVSSKKRIEKGELTIMDWGAQLHGYRSDTSRTIYQGQLSKRKGLLLEAVTEVVEASTPMIKPGNTYGEVMKAAKKTLARYKWQGGSLDDFIAHPFGHNVGLEIHEHPFFSLTEDKEILEGELIAFEPAIYIPGLGGVRIENMVHATAKGAEVLNTLPNGIQIS